MEVPRNVVDEVTNVYATADNKAVQFVMTDVLKRFHRLQLEEGSSYLLTNPLFKEKYEYLQSHDASEKKESKKPEWLFLTVSANDDTTDVSKLQLSAFKIAHKKWVQSAEWCFEQRSGGKGRHWHMIINQRGDKLLSTIRTEVVDTLIRLNVVQNKQFVQIKVLKTEDDVSKCRRYIGGDKQSAEKMAKVAEDKTWRQSHNLLDIYKHPEK